MVSLTSPKQHGHKKNGISSGINLLLSLKVIFNRLFYLFVINDIACIEKGFWI